MKRVVSVLVFIYFLIKKIFFILLGVKFKKRENSLLEAKQKRQNYTDEYHNAFSGVTRWQTL